MICRQIVGHEQTLFIQILSRFPGIILAAVTFPMNKKLLLSFSGFTLGLERVHLKFLVLLLTTKTKNKKNIKKKKKTLRSTTTFFFYPAALLIDFFLRGQSPFITRRCRFIVQRVDNVAERRTFYSLLLKKSRSRFHIPEEHV